VSVHSLTLSRRDRYKLQVSLGRSHFIVFLILHPLVTFHFFIPAVFLFFIFHSLLYSSCNALRHCMALSETMSYRT
jgi:hypothetical protein